MWGLGLLPFVLFAATGWLIHTRASSLVPVRDVIITSALLASGWAVLGTELLSLLHMLSFWPLLGWWAAPSVILLLLCRTVPARVASRRPNDPVLVGIVGGCAALLLTTFVVAAITPPNNWDALSYHLPRQMYWMQQQHLGMFPANDFRMLNMPPFAEYVSVNLMILSGGDRWVNLIQWSEFGLTALTASCIARELQCSARMQAISALLVLSIPGAALQSMNPKNDVVAAFLLCAMALKALDLSRGKPPIWLHCLFFALATGLLVLTKSTGILFAPAVAIWAGVMLFRRYALLRALRYTFLIIAIAFAINLGHWSRVYGEFHSPFGPSTSQWSASVVNTIHTPKALISNLIRNVSMHLATSSRAMNTRVLRMVEQFHRLIQFELNDQRTTFVGSRPFTVSGDFNDEDRAKAPLHVLLAMAALFPILGALVRRKDWALHTFLLTPYVAFWLFCFVLAWQEWHSRLHIPLLCVLVPISVKAFSARGAPFLFGMTIGALLLAAHSVISNDVKPLSGRDSVLTRHGRSRLQTISPEEDAGLRAVKDICGRLQPKRIGIYAEWSREYPLLKVLWGIKGRRPEFFKVNADFGRKRPRLISADLIIGWYGAPPQTDRSFHTKFTAILENGPVRIFARTPSPANPATTRTNAPPGR